MKNLYAPWRKEYKVDKRGDCIFCAAMQHAEKDSSNFVLQRFDFCYVMMNLFPYNAGHLLVIPYEHNRMISSLSYQIRSELMDVIAKSERVVTEELQAEGVNIGLNIGGKAAGGSIPEHLHTHVIPRWHGDTNFLVTVATTKQISFDMHEIYSRLSNPLLWK